MRRINVMKLERGHVPSVSAAVTRATHHQDQFALEGSRAVQLSLVCLVHAVGAPRLAGPTTEQALFARERLTAHDAYTRALIHLLAYARSKSVSPCNYRSPSVEFSAVGPVAQRLVQGTHQDGAFAE
jgi:hypothetical protein